MIGKRVDIDSSDYEAPTLPLLNEGEYGRGHKGLWRCMTPNGLMGNLAAHDVVEHEDGTITVSPSILVRQWDNLEWHGFLEKGVWKEC